ncbi:hypothetical protein [Propionivibrio limicola]|uniref:hypothetical protein n=1 Tax=Propionivibrio limicola TaxID=167645 RepID=UPI0012924B0C|nr:hypothetical protein [Propionivibrio limicola]
MKRFLAATLLVAIFPVKAAVCDDIELGDADMKDFAKWREAAVSRPECAKPAMMAGFALVNAVHPLMFYMPGAPRVCVDADPGERKKRTQMLRDAVSFANHALAIEPAYLPAWRVKLTAFSPNVDSQVGLPPCQVWNMGNAKRFMATVNDGLRSVSKVEDRFDFIKSALKVTLVQGFFRSDNWKFSPSTTSLYPKFLSAQDEQQIKRLALAEIRALMPALKGDAQREAQAIFDYLNQL